MARGRKRTTARKAKPAGRKRKAAGARKPARRAAAKKTKRASTKTPARAAKKAKRKAPARRKAARKAAPAEESPVVVVGYSRVTVAEPVIVVEEDIEEAVESEDVADLNKLP
jgi:hypothetical protein